MKTSLKTLFVFLILLVSFNNSFAQSVTLSKNTIVSVMTCGIGNELYSLFGHTAIRVSDPENHLDVVYNYGAFDFSTPNFALKFTKGDLDYFIVNDTYADFLNQYNYEKRDVYEQVLNIPLPLKQELYNNLSQSLLSDERLYQYKFIDNNCTTKVVDIINKTLKGNVITKKVDTDESYRSVLFPHFNNHFYVQLGTNILFGTKVDQMATKLFLPFELHKNLELSQFQGQSLVKENKTILNFEEQTPKSWWNNSYTFLMILSLITILNKKAIDYTYLLVMGLLGVLFVFLGFYSSHLELGYNYNIMLFNPLLLGVLYFWSTNNSKWTYKLSAFCIVVTIMYFCFIITKAHLLIVSPIIITNLFVLFRLAFRNKKQIPIII